LKDTITLQRSTVNGLLTIVAVGCVKTKVKSDLPVEACDLYQSRIWRLRRAYAEESGHPWFIMSALYGLIPPGQRIAYYEKQLKGKADDGYLGMLCVQLLELAAQAGATHIKIEAHMGAPYVSALQRAGKIITPVVGVEVIHATKGLTIGRQPAWYQQQRQ
jgi:hypothetical protein